MKLFGKKSTNAPDPRPQIVATIIITLNMETRDLKVQGNVVGNREATLSMLINALHAVANQEKPQVMPVGSA